MAIRIIKPGLLSTIQDLGRIGYQKYGVLVNGAMDAHSLRIANILVDNPEGEACIEITLQGPVIEFRSDTLISITGANLTPSINEHVLPLMRPIAVRKGAVLKFGAPMIGCRSYISAAGGFDIPRVMNSKSTYQRAKIGGFNGRALKKEDIVPIGAPNRGAERLLKNLLSSTAASFNYVSWFVGPSMLTREDLQEPLRITRGKQYDYFSSEGKELLVTENYHITRNSDRMGYRLEGKPIKLAEPLELISEPACAGTVQVPPDGQPIILMTDCQTTGGYPKIGQIIRADIRRVAQKMAGGALAFRLVSVEEAEDMFIEQSEYVRAIKGAVGTLVTSVGG